MGAAARRRRTLKWVRWESLKRYHAVYVEAMGVYWTYCGLSRRPAGISDESEEPPARCRALPPQDSKRLSGTRSVKSFAAKYASQPYGRPERLRELDQVLGICDIRDPVRLRALEVLA